MGLTERQTECLAAIRRHRDANGVMPTVAELREALGLSSKGGVHRLLCELEERGAIRRLPRRARAMRIADACPHCGGDLP